MFASFFPRVLSRVLVSCALSPLSELLYVDWSDGGETYLGLEHNKQQYYTFPCLKLRFRISVDHNLELKYILDFLCI